MFSKNNSSTTTTAAPESIAKKSNTPRSTAGAPSILGSDLIITGDIETDGDVQIDGRLDGNVKAGGVTIGEQGAVNGKIIASTAHIRGKVTGKVDANTIELSETANVQADLIQDQLVISNGAFFDGKCTRKTGGKAAKSSQAIKLKPAKA